MVDPPTFRLTTHPIMPQSLPEANCSSHPFSPKLSSHPVLFSLTGLCLYPPPTPLTPALYTLELFLVSKLPHFISLWMLPVLSNPQWNWLAPEVTVSHVVLSWPLMGFRAEGVEGKSLFSLLPTDTSFPACKHPWS